MNFDINIDRFIEAFESYKLITISIIMVTATAFLLFVLVPPKYAKIKDLNKRIERYEDAIEKKRIKNSRDIKRLENSADLKEKYNQLKSRYFTEEEYTDFIVTGAKDIARKYKVNIVDYRLGKQTDINDELVSYPFIIEVNGYYENLRKFIKDLEEYKKIVVVGDFILIKDKMKGDYPTVRVTLKLDLYTINTKKKEEKKGAKNKKG